MGTGGQGISSVAQMAQKLGWQVSGCDRAASATTQALEQTGMPVQIGHRASHLDECDALVLTPAITALQPDNPELLAAQERGLPIFTWQELLGEMTSGHCLLSVCGVHGKGTTTGMLSLMLVDGGLDPTCEIGAVVPRFNTNYRIGQSNYFVNEADEFNHNFWHYHPRLVIVTSIEFEHPEFYQNYDEFLVAFEHFIRGMDLDGDWPLPPTLIINADSPGCLDLLGRLQDWSGRLVTYSLEGGTAPESLATLAKHNLSETFEAYGIRVDGETSFQVRTRSGSIPADQVFSLQLPGHHNIQNALAALAAATLVGVPAETIARSLESFSGIRRRFEIRHQGPLQFAGDREPRQDILLIDDYAHHPTAIAATLAAARRRYPGRRIIAVYQPHMFSRTKTFFNQFLTAFDEADITMITDIFPARERDTGLVSSQQLVEAIQVQTPQAAFHVFHSGDLRATEHLLQHTLSSGDLVLVMGAGDIYQVTEAVLQTTFSEQETR